MNTQSPAHASTHHHVPAPVPEEPPRVAIKYGNLGLVPFVLGALLVWIVNNEDALTKVAWVFSGYAGAIVAFLGGVHWGLAMRAGQPGPRAFGWAMVPPVVAWLGIVMPPHAGLALLGAMLIVCYVMDRRLYLENQLGHWLTLRFRLTVFASLSCFLGAAAL